VTAFLALSVLAFGLPSPASGQNVTPVSIGAFDTLESNATDVTDDLAAGEYFYIKLAHAWSTIPLFQGWVNEIRLDGVPAFTINVNNLQSNMTVNGLSPFPYVLDPGSHSLSLVVDRDNAIAESSEANTITRNFDAEVREITLPTTFPNKWVNISVWDYTAQRYIGFDDAGWKFAPTSLTIPIRMNHWYWVGVWDYDLSQWVLYEWYIRFG